MQCISYSNGDSLGVTGTHPLYSLDRQQFIPTEDIKVGEHLLSKFGIITVVSKTYDSTPQEVYNLEVGQWHNFLVGSSGVVAHNSYVFVKEIKSASGQKIGDLYKKINDSNEIEYILRNFTGGQSDFYFGVSQLAKIAKGNQANFIKSQRVLYGDFNLTTYNSATASMGKSGLGSAMFDDAFKHFNDEKALEGIMGDWRSGISEYVTATNPKGKSTNLINFESQLDDIELDILANGQNSKYYNLGNKEKWKIAASYQENSISPITSKWATDKGFKTVKDVEIEFFPNGEIDQVRVLFTKK